jgi:predicted transcriptional regulator
LSWLWTAWVIECDNAFEAESAERLGHAFRISFAMWANGLRLVDDDGIAVAEVQRRARARCNLPGLERWGWIAIGDHPDSPRPGYGSSRGVRGETMVAPTRAGRLACELWPRVLERVEERRRERFGATAIDALDAACREPRPGAPWALPEIHPTDGFRTTLVEGPSKDRDGVPLIARLSQTLTALTVRHEHNSAVSVPLAANVLRVVDTDVVPITDLPARSGISREAIAMAVRYLTRQGFLRGEQPRAVELTAKGTAALAQYYARVDGVGGGALRDALGELVSNTEALRAALTPPPGCWRAEKPYLARTRRLLDAPTKHLPWHPMVLHRGGWPDGS